MGKPRMPRIRITIEGELGSGKSEIAKKIEEYLSSFGVLSRTVQTVEEDAYRSLEGQEAEVLIKVISLLH